MMFALIVLLVAQALAERPPWNPFCQDPPSLHFCSVLAGQGLPLPPPIPVGQDVAVWILQAPIWEFIPGVGNITKKVHLIHTAIGLVNQQTGKEYLFEFEGIYESPNATFPFVVPDAKEPGGIKLEWCNAGAVCWGEGIDWKYFSVTQKLVGVMAGGQFNKLIAWLPVENNTNSITYETFAVWDKWDNGTGHQYLPSYTCDDFAWKALGLMMTWGVKFNTNITTLERVFINWYVDAPPLQLDLTDADTYKQVTSSYAKYALADKGSACAKIENPIEKDFCAGEAALQLIQWLETNKFVLKNGHYFFMERFGLDSFNWQYHTTPVKPVQLEPDFIKHVPEHQRHLFV